MSFLAKILRSIANLQDCMRIILEKLLVPSDDFRHEQSVPSHQADLDKPLPI